MKKITVVDCAHGLVTTSEVVLTGSPCSSNEKPTVNAMSKDGREWLHSLHTPLGPTLEIPLFVVFVALLLSRHSPQYTVVLIRFAKILGEKPPIFMKFTPGFF